MAALDPRRILTAADTDPGRVRTENQDRCAEFEATDGARLVVVADGMGGHDAGGLASRVAVETIGEVFRTRSGPAEELLRQAFAEANVRVHEMGAKEPHGMGTTAVAVLLRSDGAWLANVGDSRVYRWRSGSLERLTEDHSWVFQEVAQGRMTREEAATHPRRNALLRSIGMDEEIPADVGPVELLPGDRILLCSDGLWDELDDAALSHTLAEPEPAACVRRLIELANRAGGQDNITAAVIRLLETPQRRGHRLAWTAIAALLVIISIARWCGT